MKKILAFFKLMCRLRERMTEIDETMALKEVTDIYAKYVCRMNKWKVEAGSGLSYIFCEIGFAFLNGYRKALADNGLRFQNGIVVKRDITKDMPAGSLGFYKEDIVREANSKAVKRLRKVLSSYEPFAGNINTIVHDFEEQL